MEKTLQTDSEDNVTAVKTMRSAAAEAVYAARHEARAEAVRESAVARALEEASREREARRRAGASRPFGASEPTDASDAARAAAAARAAEKEAADTTAAVECAVQAALEEARLTTRDVMPMLKLRVVGLAPPGCVEHPGEALLTVWRPDEETLARLVEGATFVVSHLTAPAPERRDGADAAVANAAPPLRGRARDGGLLELSLGRGGRWLPAHPGRGALRGLASAYVPRRYVPLSALGAEPAPPGGAEVDAVRRAAFSGPAAVAGSADACEAAATTATAQAAAAAPLFPSPCVRLGATFDSVGVLLHVTPTRPSGQRGMRQYAFLVDASLVAAAAAAAATPGTTAIDPADVTLLAVEVRGDCALQREFRITDCRAAP